MKRILTLMLAALAATSGAAHAAAERLRLHGSNTIGAKLAPALVRAWAEDRGFSAVAERRSGESYAIDLVAEGDTIRVEIEAHGTSTGYADLVAGRADIWMASRPATPQEIGAAESSHGRLDAPEHEHVIALDGLAILVHPDNPLAALSIDAVARTFRGGIRDWSELGGVRGAIVIHARDDRSGTFDTFKTIVLRGAALDPRAKRYESSDQLAAAVAADRNAIGFVGLASVGNAKALAISESGTRPLAPDRLAVATEDYALSRRLFLYHGRGATPLARDLVEFALGAAGQRVAERTGFVAQEIRALAGARRDDIAGEYAQLTRGARRLSVNFRFSAAESFFDGKALRDVERLLTFLRRPDQAHCELMLFGFADGNESNPVQAIVLSNDRADYVAATLAERGVAARRIRGMGHAAPVASDATAYGRARNRRVEVWIRDGDANGAFAASSETRSSRTGNVAVVPAG